MQFVYFIVFRAGRRITFGITMRAFAVKTSVKGAQTVADESTTNEGVADKDVAAAAVLDVIRENAGEWLTDLRLFDVYQGKGIDPHRKSLAVGLTWQHPSRTLNDDEVNSATQNILTSLEQRLNATLRK